MDRIDKGSHADFLAHHMSEDELLENIREAAKLGGWYLYHPYDSRRSQGGWVDLTLIHQEYGVLFRELKQESTWLRLDQQAVIAGLIQAGLNAWVWRPSDWYSGLIEQELRIV